MQNLISQEPIQASTVAVVVAWIAAKFALNLDATTATAIALIVMAVANWIARTLSVPLSKHDKIVNQAVSATVAGQTGAVPPKVS